MGWTHMGDAGSCTSCCMNVQVVTHFSLLCQSMYLEQPCPCHHHAHMHLFCLWKDLHVWGVVGPGACNVWAMCCQHAALADRTGTEFKHWFPLLVKLEECDGLSYCGMQAQTGRQVRGQGPPWVLHQGGSSGCMMQAEVAGLAMCAATCP